MAVLVVAAAGAYVGAAVGIGAAAGWVIGSYLYSSFLAPGQKKNVRTSELNDLRVMGTEYGQPIPYIIGTMAVAGDLWWNSDRRPVVTTSTTESGGKGGGGGTETTTTVTTYDMDALIGLCDNRIVGVMRIWDEGKLVYTAHPESPPGSVEASAETITWDRMTVYTGDPTQMPDPTYEAAFGVGNVPAYRHRAYIFFEGLHLGQSGRVPNFTFEVVTDGTMGGALRRGKHGDFLFSASADLTVTFDSTGAGVLYLFILSQDPPFFDPGSGFFIDSLNPATDWVRIAESDAGASVALFGIRQPNTGPVHTITIDNIHKSGVMVMGFTGDADFTNATGAPTTYIWGGDDDAVTSATPTIGMPTVNAPYPDGLAPFMPDQLAITALSLYWLNLGSDTSTGLTVTEGFVIQEEHPLIAGVNTGGAAAWEKNPPVGVLRHPTWTWVGANSGATLLKYVDPPMVPGEVILSETVSLQETVRRLLVRCGMVEGTQFDVSALDDSGGSAGAGFEISPWIEVGQLVNKVGTSGQQPYSGASDGTYVLMPHAGTYVNTINLPGLTPADWTDATISEAGLDGGDIAYGDNDNIFIVVGGGSSPNLAYSYDQGQTWAMSPTFPGGGGYNQFWSLAYGDGNYLAVNRMGYPPGTAGESLGLPNVRVSIDGKIWSNRPNAQFSHWADVAYGGGWFVAVAYATYGSIPQVMRTNDHGVTWEYITVPGGTWNRIVYSGDGHFVAVMNGISQGQAMNGAIMTSSDYGATWTLRNASHSKRWSSLATNGNGAVVAVASDNDPDNSMVSFDHGATWALVPLAKRISFSNVTWGKNGYFYAQGQNLSGGFSGTGNWGWVLPLITIPSATRPVRALYVSQVSPTRQTIDALASTYFFDMVVSDKLYFRPRGGAIAATIPYEDLGAAFDGSADELDQFILKNSGDLEFPARVSLVYRNVMHEYQVDTQTSDRLVSASADTAKVITLPLCFTPGEAKQVADVMLFNQAVNMLSVDSIKVLGDYVALEPTDPVTVFDAQGNSYRMRLTSRRDEYPLLEYSAVLDDVAVLTSSGVTDENYEESFVVEAVPLTVDLLLDIPMLRDADTDLGMYAVAKGATGAKWPGCVIYVSGDGVNYDSVGAIAYPNVFGICQTTLGNWPRGRLIDELNRVTVNIGPGASLSSSTYERVVNNETINACVIGDEVLQFIDATATGDGIYVLSRLLRGSQGTERAMGAHTAGERFALLDPGRLGRVATPNNLLGVPLQYKFVTIGKTLESDAPETVANTGVNLKPISPVYLQVYRDPANNDATITWERRSRLAVRVLGPAGIDVPPDEVGWEVDVYTDGTYATKVRTITATVAARPSAVYYAAEQSADGLTPGAPLFLRIYPMSGAVGRGFPLTASM